MNESTQPFTHDDVAACRLKSEALSLIGTRVNNGHANKACNLSAQELLERANDLNCHLWMLTDTLDVSDIAVLDTLAGCFNTLADAMELANEFARDVQQTRRASEPLLAVVAKAQSALRKAICSVNGPDDDEQHRVFRWLKDTTEETRTFISRHMKRDDPADPQSWPSIADQIESFRELRRAQEARQRMTATLFDDLYALVSELEQADDDATGHLWSEVTKLVDELVENGVPPSSLEFRELLRPHMVNAPDKVESMHFDRVRQYVCQDRQMASRQTHPANQLSAAIGEVATLLRDQSVVLIGADERPHHKAALTKCFGLKALIWVSTSHGTSVKTFEPFVARQDVAIVLLAIRWASHSYGDVERFCNRYGKPLVRLPGGYSPDQVAHQILSQCSDRLREANAQGDGDAA